MTSIENFINDIIEFIKKFFRTFYFTVFRYDRLLNDLKRNKAIQILPARIFLPLCIFTLAIILIGYLEMAKTKDPFSEFFSATLGSFSRLSLPEKIFYTLPITIIIYLFGTAYCYLFFKKSNDFVVLKQLTIYYVSTLLCLIIMLAFILGTVESIANEVIAFIVTIILALLLAFGFVFKFQSKLKSHFDSLRVKTGINGLVVLTFLSLLLFVYSFMFQVDFLNSRVSQIQFRNGYGSIYEAYDVEIRKQENGKYLARWKMIGVNNTSDQIYLMNPTLLILADNSRYYHTNIGDSATQDLIEWQPDQIKTLSFVANIDSSTIVSFADKKFELWLIYLSTRSMKVMQSVRMPLGFREYP